MDDLRYLIDLNQENDTEKTTDETINKPDSEATIEPKVMEISNKDENKSDTSEKEVQSAKGGTKLLMIVENVKGHEETFSGIEKTNLENKKDSSVKDKTCVKDDTLSKIEMRTDSHCFMLVFCYNVISL